MCGTQDLRARERKSFRACSSFPHVLNIPSLSLWMGTAVLSWRRSSTRKLSARNFQRTGENASTAVPISSQTAPNPEIPGLVEGSADLVCSQICTENHGGHARVWPEAWPVSAAEHELSVCPMLGSLKLERLAVPFQETFKNTYSVREVCKFPTVSSLNLTTDCQQLLPDGECGSRGFLGKQK